MTQPAPAPQEQPEPSEPKHRYFVSFAVSNGYGNGEVALKYPIRGTQDIAVVTQILRRAGGGADLCVLNFVPLPD